jgi:hypothetical protein
MKEGNFANDVEYANIDEYNNNNVGYTNDTADDKYDNNNVEYANNNKYVKEGVKCANDSNKYANNNNNYNNKGKYSSYNKYDNDNMEYANNNVEYVMMTTGALGALTSMSTSRRAKLPTTLSMPTTTSGIRESNNNKYVKYANNDKNVEEGNIANNIEYANNANKYTNNGDKYKEKGS